MPSHHQISTAEEIQHPVVQKKRKTPRRNKSSTEARKVHAKSLKLKKKQAKREAAETQREQQSILEAQMLEASYEEEEQLREELLREQAEAADLLLQQELEIEMEAEADILQARAQENKEKWRLDHLAESQATIPFIFRRPKGMRGLQHIERLTLAQWNRLAEEYQMYFFNRDVSWGEKLEFYHTTLAIFSDCQDSDTPRTLTWNNNVYRLTAEDWIDLHMTLTRIFQRANACFHD